MYHTWLRSFYAVSRAGSFTGAARAVGVGQSTITAQVRALEQRFKTELFYRRGRRVEISKAGQELLSIAQGIFGHEDEAIRYLTALRDFKTGQVNIGAITPFVAVELMEAFHKRRPHIRLNLFLGHADEVLRSLLEFGSDVVVLSHFEQDRRFVVRPYKRCGLVAIVDTDHPWAGRKAVSVRDLRGQRLVMREPSSTTRQLVERAARRSKVPLDKFVEINSREGVCQAVARGFGVGIVAELEFIPLKRLRPVQIVGPDLEARFYLTALASRRSQPLIDELFQVATALEPDSQSDARAAAAVSAADLEPRS